MLRTSSLFSSLVIGAGLLVTPALAAGVTSVTTDADSSVQMVNLSTEGPMIELLSPENGGIYTSPIGIEIAFEPKEGTTVDLSTLKVTVVSTTLAGVFEVDITEDIIGFASEKGIKASDAEIPAGEHVVTIEVADTENRLSQHQLSITVREPSVLERRDREK